MSAQLIILGAALLLTLPQWGCGRLEAKVESRRDHIQEPVIIVVAPVINLSDAYDVDVVQLTDWIASEFAEFPNVAVTPVNMTMAALARRGKVRVETPADARDLASEFGADATVVTALTEYDPYDPPRVGMVMQWYGSTALRPTWLDPVTASRLATAPNAGPGGPGGPPTFQVQRSYSADHLGVLKEIKLYASQRDGAQSAFGWRKFTKSQELFVRYCAWSSFRTMLTVQNQYEAQFLPTEADE